MLKINPERKQRETETSCAPQHNMAEQMIKSEINDALNITNQLLLQNSDQIFKTNQQKKTPRQWFKSLQYFSNSWWTKKKRTAKSEKDEDQQEEEEDVKAEQTKWCDLEIVKNRHKLSLCTEMMDSNIVEFLKKHGKITAVISTVTVGGYSHKSIEEICIDDCIDVNIDSMKIAIN